jgi:uncharacterized protein Yka (UPF0111/DUF47 family)
MEQENQKTEKESEALKRCFKEIGECFKDLQAALEKFGKQTKELYNEIEKYEGDIDSELE